MTSEIPEQAPKRLSDGYSADFFSLSQFSLDRGSYSPTQCSFAQFFRKEGLPAHFLSVSPHRGSAPHKFLTRTRDAWRARLYDRVAHELVLYTGQSPVYNTRKGAVLPGDRRSLYELSVEIFLYNWVGPFRGPNQLLKKYLYYELVELVNQYLYYLYKKTTREPQATDLLAYVEETRRPPKGSSTYDSKQKTT